MLGQQLSAFCHCGKATKRCGTLHKVKQNDNTKPMYKSENGCTRMQMKTQNGRDKCARVGDTERRCRIRHKTAEEGKKAVPTLVSRALEATLAKTVRTNICPTVLKRATRKREKKRGRRYIKGPGFITTMYKDTSRTL